MKIFYAASLILCLMTLSACPTHGGGKSHNRLAGPAVSGSMHFKESSQGLMSWESSPPLAMWVTQVGISAEQSAVRLAVAQRLVQASRTRDGFVYVAGDIDLAGASITCLPDGLVVAGNLDLSSSAVENLDIRLVVRGNLNIERTAISLIPSSVRIDKNLLADDSAVAQMATPLHVGGDVSLSHTPISALPAHLTINGDLVLRGTPLASLPEGLHVGGTLDISYCPVRALAADIFVGKDVIAIGTQLSGALPQAWLAPSASGAAAERRIDLRDTDLSYDEQAYLRLIQHPGVHIVLGSCFACVADAPPQPDDFTVGDYIAAFRSQLEIQPQYQNIAVCDWHLSPSTTANMRAFVHHLYQAQSGDAGVLAARIVALYAHMQADAGARQDVIASFADTTCATPEQALYLLNKAEQALHVAQIGMQSTSVGQARQLGVRMLHLQTIQQFAHDAAQRYNVDDERCVEETFVYALRKALALPITGQLRTAAMCRVITEQDLTDANQAALRASQSPEQLNHFLTTFAPYQRYLRKQLADNLVWDAYKEQTPILLRDANALCPLTNTPLADLSEPATIEMPHVADAPPTPYEFAALIQWWWQTGTVPLSQQEMELSAVRRACVETAP